jgi:hypothetical protein
MNSGLSDLVRTVAQERYVKPAKQAGKLQFSIRVRDLLNDLQTEGFPAGHTPQICSALQTSKFLRENGIQIEGTDGPPSKQSPTVVVHYRVASETVQHGVRNDLPENAREPVNEETPEEWAHRTTSKLQGLLKNEIAEMGGAQAYMRWVRSDDEEAQ